VASVGNVVNVEGHNKLFNWHPFTLTSFVEASPFSNDVDLLVILLGDSFHDVSILVFLLICVQL
jgi:hypothetical protein